MISAGQDGTVRIWAPPGRRIFTAPQSLYGAALSSDDEHIVDWGDGGIQIRDAVEGTIAARLERAPERRPSPAFPATGSG